MAEFKALFKIQRLPDNNGFHVWIPDSEADGRRRGLAFSNVKAALGQGIRWVRAEDDGDPALLVERRQRVNELTNLLNEAEKGMEEAERLAADTGINLTEEDWEEIDDKSPIIVALLSGEAGGPWIDKYGVPVVMGLAKLRDKDKDGDLDIDVTLSWSPYKIPRP